MLWDSSWVNIEKNIDVIDAFSPSAFDDYKQAKTPVIIKGEFNESSAIQKWSSDYFRQHLGEKKFHVYVSPDGNFPGWERAPPDTEKKIVSMSLNEFLDRIFKLANHEPFFSSDEKYYVFHAPDDLFDEIKHEVPELAFTQLFYQAGPSFYNSYDNAKYHIWISQAGVLTPPHTDTWLDNFLIQAHGEKKVLLWDPSQVDSLYITPYGETYSRQTEIDICHPDRARFPAFENAHAIAGTLTAGDILYLPEGWIHTVYSNSFSISVNYWFKNPMGFNKYFSDLIENLKKCDPRLRKQYLHLLRWPDEFLDLTF